MSEEKINLVIILEMLGRPADYAKETMEKLISEKIAKEKGVEIISKSVSEPKKVENQDLFTLFAELELRLESINELLVVIFKYMPSHVEIITPENLRVKNDELNFFSNELTRKLHQYDEVAKALTIEKNMLREQIQKLGQVPVELFKKPAEPSKPKQEKKKVRKKKAKKK